MMSSRTDKSFVRRRQGHVIIDSSDDDDDEDDIESVEMNVGLAVASGQTRGVEMNVDQTVAPIVASGHAADFRDDDDDSDDSDASFTRLLKSLHVSKELVVKETEMEVVDDKDDEDDDDESVDESVERPPTAKELEEAGVEAGTAFNLDRSNDCILISSENTDASNCKQWPDFRIPVKLFQRLFDYQKVGVQWMAGLHENRIGAILADDMGLGKTFMTLTYLGGLMKAGTIRNALIVAPLSVLRAWENEAAKVLTLSVPNVKVQVLSSDIAANRRLQALQEALECSSELPHLIISTYGLVRSSPNAFLLSDDSFWDYVVLDEGHGIKNQNAAVSKCCHVICSHPVTRRLLLTGTPILNKLEELWAVFDWATSGQVLGTMRDFKKRFAKPIEAARDKQASHGTLQLGQRANKELQALLKPYFLQRMKIDCLKDKLPAKIEVVLWTHLSIEQRSMYTNFVNNSQDVTSIISGEKTSPLTAVTWLKKLCGHPLLAAKGEEGETTDTIDTLDHEEIVRQSSKLGVLVDLINNFSANGHRTLIFSQSTKMLNIIEKVLWEVTLARIDGTTPGKDRQMIVDDFNRSNSPIDAILLSTKAAGVGLTLTGADRVIIYDPSWTPAEDNQAVDRSYRIGQTREVVVYRMIAAGTVEEKMYEKQVHKDGIRRAVFMEGVSVERHFDKSDLSKLFTLAPHGVCSVMAKVNEAAKGLRINWDRHEFVLSLKGVVGLSRHDGFYKQTVEGAQEPEVLAQNIPAKKVLGKSQRVLQNETIDLVPVGQTVIEIEDEDNKENATVDLVSSPARGTYKEKVVAVDLSSSPPEAIEIESESRPTLELYSDKVQEMNVSTRTEVIGMEGDEEEMEDTKGSLATPAKTFDSDIPSTTAVDPSEAVSNDEAQQVDKSTLTTDETEDTLAAIFLRAEWLHGNACPKRALQLLLDLLQNRYGDLDSQQKIELHAQICRLSQHLGLLQPTN